MAPIGRFIVALDACTIFPMSPRDVLLTLASHEFFAPKWSPRIREEWTRNLLARIRERSADTDAQTRVERIAAAMALAFPDAKVDAEAVEPDILAAVNEKIVDRPTPDPAQACATVCAGSPVKSRALIGSASPASRTPASSLSKTSSSRFDGGHCRVAGAWLPL
jgi:hypothetical protein